MYRIIDERGTGKTSKLMRFAQENNAIIACSNPNAMYAKAERYGIIGLDFISYSDCFNHNYPKNAMILIDELELYVKATNNDLGGYTLSNED